MPLTPQEKNFGDHLDYESTHAPYEEGVPVPACNWMKARGLVQPDIWNILMLRRWERKDVMLTPKPSEPYAPAWKTCQEAKQRNQELAEEFGDAEAVRSERTGRTHLGEE